MKKIFENIKFWYNNARPYSVPITVLSWLVIFCYSLKLGGNVLNGLIALIGIMLVHLSTNLSDDFFDYKRLMYDEEFLNNSKPIKCRYLRSGKATITDLRNVIIILLLIAAVLGGILLLRSGWYVILFALAVLPIALLYSKLSSKGFGDLAIILAYGPLMYEGVYYVMTKSLSFDVFILSIACSMFVNTILYAHMLMDYDEDVFSGKTTLCTILKNKDKALKFLLVFYVIGYISISYLAIKSSNYYYFITICIIPLIFNLYKLLNLYNKNNNHLPQIKFWYKPLDKWNTVSQTPDAPFLIRFMFTRNISTWFMLLTSIAIIFG